MSTNQVKLEEIEKLLTYRIKEGHFFDSLAVVRESLVPMLRILKDQELRLAEMSDQIKNVKASSDHANNAASCLANGIKPD